MTSPRTHAPHLPIEQAQDIFTNTYKQDFPLLNEYSNLHFLDSAATAQRPACVLDALQHFYTTMNANALRGLYDLSSKATIAIKEARASIAKFIGAPREQDIIFCRNTSEALNMVALAYAPSVLQPEDEVVISIMEHHSNLIPWQQVCAQTGAKLVYMHPNEDGEITSDIVDTALSERTKIVAIGHVSNVMGTQAPIAYISQAAHRFGAVVVVDGAQSVPHMPIDVAALDCDFYAFSGHKMFAPFGIGVLWGQHELLEAMPPFLTGGEMIDAVSERSATWAPVPEKFEAGTQDGAGAYALAEAVHYMLDVGIEQIAAREQALISYALERMNELPFVQVLGTKDATKRHGVIAFNIEGVHPHDVAGVLDSKDVAIRAGHHCAQPLLAWLEVGSTCRASFAFYNDASDVDALIEALQFVWEMFHE